MGGNKDFFLKQKKFPTHPQKRLASRSNSQGEFLGVARSFPENMKMAKYLGGTQI